MKKICKNCKFYKGKGTYLSFKLIACSAFTDKRKFRLKTEQENCPAFKQHQVRKRSNLNN